MPRKIGLSFSLSGDLRFLSHQDMLRLLSRALRRARLEVCYSQGYSPRVRLWLMPARPLGVACREDLLVVETSDNCPAEEFRSRLSAQLPAGMNLGNCADLGATRPPQPLWATYGLALSEEEAAGTSQRITAVMDCRELPVERCAKRTGQRRQMDIRPCLQEMALDGKALSFRLSCDPAGSARPAEVLALLGLDNPRNRAELVRNEIKYDKVQMKIEHPGKTN